MRIAILAWGSLCWDRRELNIIDEWFIDGPILPIEFSRISGGNRLTLVITPGFDTVTTLYAISGLDDLPAAIENLRIREKAPSSANIGFINFKSGEVHVRQTNLFMLQILRDWNATKGFDAIIWSDFSQRFTEVTNTPFNLQNVIQFVNRLSEVEKEAALSYIRRAPQQVKTRFREEIVAHFKKIE